jgi:hypothetical protein
MLQTCSIIIYIYIIYYTDLQFKIVMSQKQQQQQHTPQHHHAGGSASSRRSRTGKDRLLEKGNFINFRRLVLVPTVYDVL